MFAICFALKSDDASNLGFGSSSSLALVFLCLFHFDVILNSLASVGVLVLECVDARLWSDEVDYVFPLILEGKKSEELVGFLIVRVERPDMRYQ